MNAKLENSEFERKKLGDQSKAQIDALKQQVEDGKSAIPELEARVREIEAEKLEINARVAASKEKQKMAEQTLDTYKKKLAELEPKLRVAETDTVKFQSLLEVATAEKERLQQELRELNEQHRNEMKVREGVSVFRFGVYCFVCVDGLFVWVRKRG